MSRHGKGNHSCFNTLSTKMAEVPKAATEEDKGDSQTVTEDGDRQVLAPAEGPREDLINTAVKFLQNPKVMGSPLHQKKAFLSKKGLTQEEINLAVQRSGVTEVTSTTSPGQDNIQMRPPPSAFQPGPPVPAPYGPPAIPPQSRWAQFRDLTVTSVVVVGVSYAMYHLYKTYIEPLIRGKSAHEKRLERLESEVEAIHKSVTESLSDISRTLAAIQGGINNQSQQSLVSQNVGRGITDLKADISSLRSLLLSKNQFPAPPSNPPVLPSWQLAEASSSVGLQQASGDDTSTSTNLASSTSTLREEEATSASHWESSQDRTGSEGEPRAEVHTQPEQTENQLSPVVDVNGEAQAS